MEYGVYTEVYIEYSTTVKYETRKPTTFVIGSLVYLKIGINK